MPHRTVSEVYFERFCDCNRVPFTRITPNGVPKHKHPDYKILCDGHEVIVEVKEVGESDSRNALRQRIEAGVPGLAIPNPEEQVRRMIASGLKQIKPGRGKTPAIIVLYDEQSIIRIDGPAVRAGMYPPDEAPNPAISAVGLLTTDAEQRVRLDFFHNDHATIAFDPEWLRCAEITHYRLSGDGISQWEIF